MLDSELDLSGAALTLSEVTDAASVLELFVSLKHINLSNLHAPFLTIRFLRALSKLTTLNGDNCDFLFPPLGFFSTSHDLNPLSIQGFLCGRSLDTEMNLSKACLTMYWANEVATLLSYFTFLKRLDISNNDIRLIPVGMLRLAAGLDSFKCDNCTMLLPPQYLLSDPLRNPKIVRALLNGEFNLSQAFLTKLDWRTVASSIHLYPETVHVDLSCNPYYGGPGASAFLSSLSGVYLVRFIFLLNVSHVFAYRLAGFFFIEHQFVKSKSCF